MSDPYASPRSEVGVSPAPSGFSIRRIILLIGFCSLAIEIVSWMFVPRLNALFAEIFRFTGVDYWTIRLSFDLINSLVVHCIFVLFFVRCARFNAFVFSFACAFVGFCVFFFELDGFSCLGRCGLPLWYDIAGFVTPFVDAMVSGSLANKFILSRGDGATD